MPANAVVRARIDQRVKEEAARRFCGAAGLTISDAFRMMLMRTVADKALPFDPLGTECGDHRGHEGGTAWRPGDGRQRR